MTKSKKMLALVIALVIMLVAVSGTLIAVLVAGNQSAQSKIHVKYTSSDVNVRVEAKYYVGSTGTDMIDKSNSNAKSIELDANKTSGSLDQPASEVSLSKTNNKIIYEYKFTNLSTTIPATIGQLVENGSVVVPKDSNNNVKLTYTSSSSSLGAGASSDATTLNTQGLPAGTTRYVYVIVSIVELLNDVDFEGTFGWDLAKGTTASIDTTGSGNSVVNVNTSQAGFYNAAALQNIDIMVGVENQEPEIYPMIANKCFTGWYTNSALTTKAVFPMVVTADTKLYPKNETATSGLVYGYSASSQTYHIGDGSSSFAGTATEIIIPDMFDDGTNGLKEVKSVYPEAFSGCVNISEVVFPKNLVAIGRYAFDGCSSLTSINLPKGLIELNRYAFKDCNNVKSIIIESENLMTFDNSVFYNCSKSLVSIKVTSSSLYLRSEGNCLIDTRYNILLIGCRNSVIPNYITDIVPWAFYNCKQLSNINIPVSVEYIGNEAFYGCDNLTSVVFDDTIGWKSGGTSIDISKVDYTANALLLRTADGSFSKS